MRLRTIIGLATTPLLAVGVALPTAMAASATATTTTLSATMTASGSQTVTYPWTLTKTASPDTLNLWQGARGTVTYKIHAEKGAAQDTGAVVSGDITVTNGGGTGAPATEGLVVKPQLVTNGNNGTVLATSNDIAGQHSSLAAGESFTYKYSIPVSPGVLTNGVTYKVLCGVTITNHSGPGGAVTKGPDTKATFIFSSQVTGQTLHVTDTNMGSGPWDFSDSGQQTYKVDYGPYDKPELGKVFENTAKGDHGESSTADVTVNVYALDVSKTAQAGLTRTYKWELGKPEMKDTKVTEAAGGNYSIPVTVTHTDSKWGVSGVITIKNTAPIDAVIMDVSDKLSDGTKVTLTDAPDFPYTLKSGATLEIKYSAALSGAVDGSNQVDVKIETATFSALADYLFSRAQIEEIDKGATIHNVGTITGNDTNTPGTGSDQQLQVTDP